MPAFHCLTLTNNEAVFAQDGYWVPVMANTRAPGNGPNNTPPRLIIDGEPDLLTSTLDDWIHYREKLATQPQNDENVRLAITASPS
jgi:hypothetical protein